MAPGVAMGNVHFELVDLSNEVWHRTRARLDGAPTMSTSGSLPSGAGRFVVGPVVGGMPIWARRRLIRRRSPRSHGACGI
ncbi:MAG: hypothetical protein HRT86_09920 [Ilumatobacteraceae bacterium]|nr:hypothetical protein [Ilumatobacteraceae bacterium]